MDGTPESMECTNAKRPKLPQNYPLFCHTNGQLAKKINGRVCYFGTCDDLPDAKDRYLAVREYIIHGRDAQPKPSQLPTC